MLVASLVRWRLNSDLKARDCETDIFKFWFWYYNMLYSGVGTEFLIVLILITRKYECNFKNNFYLVLGCVYVCVCGG